MDETSALAVTAVRAVETADRARTLWTDADRSWASRAAAEVVGESSPPAEFVARRAEFAQERMRERGGALARLARAWRWRPWAGAVVIAAAFVLGISADGIGGARRINIVYSPVLPLVVWNLVVYAMLAAGYVARYGDPGAPGPLRHTVAWLAGVARGRTGASGAGDDPVSRAFVIFAADWSGRAASLYAARAARILHVAAAALALGVVAVLYVRGIGFEYRAMWESTFLDATTARAIVAAAYGPGALLTQVGVPDAAHIAAIRAPASENAAPWLHLMAATLMVVVIVPRAALALWAALVERHRAARVIDDMRDPYFARVLRSFHSGVATARVLPYSYEVDAASLASLRTLLARSLGGEVALGAAPAVVYGDEVLPDLSGDDMHAPLLALFNATATPESEVHGNFLAALRGLGRPLVVVVDESTFNARWGGDDSRRAARRALWRELCADHASVPVFVDLAHPDAETAEAAFDAALEERLPVDPARGGA